MISSGVCGRVMTAKKIKKILCFVAGSLKNTQWKTDEDLDMSTALPDFQIKYKIFWGCCFFFVFFLV